MESELAIHNRQGKKASLSIHNNTFVSMAPMGKTLLGRNKTYMREACFLGKRSIPESKILTHISLDFHPESDKIKKFQTQWYFTS